MRSKTNSSGIKLYPIMNTLILQHMNITFISSALSTLKWVWQLPQHLIAVITIIVIDKLLCLDIKRQKDYNGKRVYETLAIKAGMSLGNYIFLTRKNTTTLKHEYGHSKQSEYLGLLYLPIIGIPSLLHNVIYRLFRKMNIKWNYYSFYPVAWANKIVGIKLSTI